MVFLINIVPLLVILFGFIGIYFIPKVKTKFIALAVLVAVSLVYMQIQPSYMPKGTVKPMPTVEFKQLDIPIVDRSLKPKSSEQYDAERIAEMEAIDKSIKNQIKLNKE